ncbi:MAG: hypothetical protein IJY42_04585 [Clostridia bacterium]|nr:hypothetical protein [Clostridia bacterium]
MPIVGWAIVGAIAVVLVTLIVRKNHQLKAEYALSATAKTAEKETAAV